MKYLKNHWKEILIIILSLLFVSNCTGKGNYKRKYNAQIFKTEFVIDSMNTVYQNSSHYIDSLRNVILFKENEIKSLNKEISIYKDQNNKLANKPVVVKFQNQNNE